MRKFIKTVIVMKWKVNAAAVDHNDDNSNNNNNGNSNNSNDNTQYLSSNYKLKTLM